MKARLFALALAMAAPAALAADAPVAITLTMPAAQYARLRDVVQSHLRFVDVGGSPRLPTDAEVRAFVADLVRGVVRETERADAIRSHEINRQPLAVD